MRAAIGSTLFRSPGRSKPVQYAARGSRRSAWPITPLKCSMYPSKRDATPSVARRSMIPPLKTNQESPAYHSSSLFLLCHKRGWSVETARKQHGHRGRRLASATAISRRMDDIEFGVWRSGRIGSAARAVTLAGDRDLCTERLDEGARGGNRTPLGDEESIGRDGERRVVVEAAPAPAFVVIEPDFLF